MDDTTLATSGVEPAPDAEMMSRLGLGRTQRRSMRTWAVIALVAGLILAVAAYFLLRGGGGTDYVTQPVERGSLQIAISATGTLAPRDEVEVGAEVSGRIDTVYVDFNDKVRKGQTLAQINTDQIQAQLRQARASHAQAQATVLQAAKALERARKLAQQQAVSQQSLESAIADLDRARASLALAEAQVDQFQTLLSKTTIRSPIDGVVLNRKIEPGQTVIASLQTPVLFTLASDLSHMELDVDIDEADVGQVRAGLKASFAVDAYPSRRFMAELVSVHNSPKTVNGVVTYQGVLWVDNSNDLLRPGMTATADIEAASIEDAILVPNGALRFIPPQDLLPRAPAAPETESGVEWGRVWVSKNGTLEPRDLKLGASDGTRTQVLEGEIGAGDDLVVDIGHAAASLSPSTAATLRVTPRPQVRLTGAGAPSSFARSVSGK